MDQPSLMPGVRTNSRSFAGGEVTPEFWGHIDDAKYQTGLARCRNFVVKPHGPVENRAGFRFVREVKLPAAFTRLIPFCFASNQTLVVEMGSGYFRFHTLGGTVLESGDVNAAPYEIANPYSVYDLASIHYVQSGDVLTLVHPNYPPKELRRLGATNWTLVDISFVSTLTPPSGVAATATPAGSPPGSPLLQAYVVTAIANNGLDESPASAGGGSVAITGITNANPGVFTVGADAGPWLVNDTVFISGVGGMSQVNNTLFQIATITAFPGYTVLTVKSGGTPVNTTSYGAYVGGGTIAREGGARCSNNLFDSGAYNTIVWNAVAGAERYNVYKQFNGLFGYIGSSTNATFTDDNIAPDLSKTPPLANNPFVGVGNYPGAVGYVEQRRGFAGTNNAPANFWGTRSGTETSLNYSLPTRADDSIAFRVAARERNTIRHIVTLDNLLLLTDAAEWKVTAASGGALAADDPISIKPQSYIGSNNAQPVIVNSNLIFAASRGGHLRELSYSWQQSGYITGDLSLRAPHLFDSFEITDLAYSKAPIPIVWAVSSAGYLIGMTYVPEQNLGPLHWHDTDGAFESITTVSEGGEDVLYAVVRRTINGSVTRYVERQETRQQRAASAAFFVDAGATFDAGPVTLVTTIGGLTWLEGKTVSILADGAAHPPRVVVGGTIALDVPSRVVTVGLPYFSDFQSLPLAFEIQGYGQGRQKNVNEAWVRVYQSSDFLIGPGFDSLVDSKLRTTEAMGAPIALRDDEVAVKINPRWADGGQVCIRQAQPLPLTVVSLSLDVAVGG